MEEGIHAVFTSMNIHYLFSGLLVTLQVALIAILLSIPIGTALALIRTYSKKFPSRIAGVYIELFRNTPNLLWVFVCFIAAPFNSDVARCAMAYVLFTSAMMAEIVRGGLNSISKGQFEAAESQGFGFMSTLWYIIIPQCFRRIIPTMMSPDHHCHQGYIFHGSGCGCGASLQYKESYGNALCLLRSSDND